MTTRTSLLKPCSSRPRSGSPLLMPRQRASISPIRRSSASGAKRRCHAKKWVQRHLERWLGAVVVNEQSQLCLMSNHLHVQ